MVESSLSKSKSITMKTAGETYVFSETDALSSMLPSGAHDNTRSKINRLVGVCIFVPGM